MEKLHEPIQISEWLATKKSMHMFQRPKRWIHNRGLTEQTIGDDTVYQLLTSSLPLLYWAEPNSFLARLIQ